MIPGTKTTIAMDMADFNKVLLKYQSLSSRTWVESVNQRAANLAMKAARYTPSAKASSVRAELQGASRVAPGAPLAAILTNYFRGKKGKKGLTGRPMKRSERRAVRYRTKGTNFLKSAWYGCIADLQPYIKAIRVPRNKVGFKTKGKAIPERRRNPINAHSTIIHGITAGSTIRGLKSALQKAISIERKDMLNYIRRKMGQDWQSTKR
jgi:hypothetical protein